MSEEHESHPGPDSLAVAQRGQDPEGLQPSNIWVRLLLPEPFHGHFPPELLALPSCIQGGIYIHLNLMNGGKKD